MSFKISKEADEMRSEYIKAPEKVRNSLIVGTLVKVLTKLDRLEHRIEQIEANLENLDAFLVTHKGKP